MTADAADDHRCRITTHARPSRLIGRGDHIPRQGLACRARLVAIGDRDPRPVHRQRRHQPRPRPPSHPRHDHPTTITTASPAATAIPARRSPPRHGGLRVLSSWRG
jgi:hypothetical protein